MIFIHSLNPTKTKQKNFKGLNLHKEERDTKFWKLERNLELLGTNFKD